MPQRWIKSSLYALGDRISALIFGFGSVFILLRMLTQESFGEWALFITLTAFIEVARNGLIQNALIKYLAGHAPDEHATITTASFVLNCLLTLVSIGFLLFAGGFLNQLWHTQQMQTLCQLYCFTTLALIPLSQYNFLQQANSDFRAIFWTNFVRQGIFFAFVAYNLIIGFKVSLTYLAACQIVAAVVASGVAYSFSPKMSIWSSSIEWKWVNTLFQFGKFVLGTNLAAMIYKSVDKFMLGALLPTTAPVAIYDVAIRINNINEVPTLSLAAILFPENAKRAQTDGTNALKYLYEKSVGIMLALVLPGIIFINLFPKLVILLLAGEQYLETANLLRLTTLFGFFLPFAIQFGSVFDAMGKPHLNFAFVVVGTLLNTLLNFLFISRFGLNGAVYATLLTFVLTFIGNQVLLRKHLDISFINILKYLKDFYPEAWQLVLYKIKPSTTP